MGKFSTIIYSKRLCHIGVSADGSSLNFLHLKRLQIRRDHNLLKSVNKEEERVNIQESINEESLN